MCTSNPKPPTQPTQLHLLPTCPERGFLRSKQMSGFNPFVGKEGSASATADNLTGGWANYADLATQSTMINIVGGAAAVKIPNDALGTFTTDAFLPMNKTQLYNATTQQMDITGLNVGDMLGVRFDIEVITSSNSQEVEISAVFGIGSPSEFPTVLAQGSKKLAGSVRFFREVSFAAFNTDFTDFPAELRISSDSNCTLKVNGFFMRATLIGR